MCYRVVDVEDKTKELTEKYHMLEKKLLLSEQMTQQVLSAHNLEKKKSTKVLDQLHLDKSQAHKDL